MATCKMLRLFARTDTIEMEREINRYLAMGFTIKGLAANNGDVFVLLER